jgi:methyltransferase (TIGR00027 family)
VGGAPVATQQADWDIVSGIGITALAVSAARAVETSRPDRLVDDPHAVAFVQAAPTDPPLAVHADPSRPTDPMQSFSSYMGVRSRFFDTYFAAAGPTQVVVLAAGLDTRGYRLDWPADTVLYELDVPKVLGFKERVLAEHDVRPRCELRPVRVDLRDDWPAALLAAGFDRDRPTAWLAEGLLPFLPDDATRALFAHVHALSAVGSTLAAEHVHGDIADLVTQPPMSEMRSKLGFSVADMWPTDKTFEPADWLTEHGWTATATPADQLARDYGRPFGPELAAMRASRLISARRTT